MKNIKILFFAIITTAVAFDITSARTFDDDDDDTRATEFLNKLRGEWYFVAAVQFFSNTVNFPCITMNITTNKNSEYLPTVVTTILDGVEKKYDWLIEFYGNKMLHYVKEENGNLSEPLSISYEVFPDSGLLVLYNVSAIQPYTIYSRSRFPAEDTLKVYEQIAIDKLKHMKYVNNLLCSVRNLEQKNIDHTVALKLHGVWYLIYRICPPGNYNSHINFINYLKIETTVDYELQIEVYEKTKILTRKYQWQAKIFLSSLYELDQTRSQPPIYNITFYAQDTEMLVKIYNISMCYDIWGRPAFDSEKSLKRYGPIAENKNWTLITINH